MLMNEELTEAILSAAFAVHSGLGAGLLESAYEICLCHELSKRGIKFRRQVELPIVYDGVLIDCGYRIDILVDETVIVEIKAIEKLLPIHEAQLMTYLKLSGKRVGLLINFNVKALKDGIIRRVL
ncbi:MAG TPA: GxxExxY protein [Tepidisphaeraceae bacterium]|jgi:GxxExxY protein|nr:GxxExxY protein [Tepidisphaeraceae bacterium]